MVMDPIDGQGVKVAASGPEDDERAVLLVDSAVEAEDFGERDFGDAAAADGRDTGASEMLERHALAIGADDLLDRRARNREILAGDRQRSGPE